MKMAEMADVKDMTIAGVGNPEFLAEFPAEVPEVMPVPVAPEEDIRSR
jgi:hypothetical protein